jgi:signal transduction histidine kinase
VTIPIGERQGVRGLGRLVGASFRNRSAARRWAAWVLAVAGPALVGLGLLPFRGHIGLAALLFSLLLPVVAVAVIGGVWPALTAVVAGFLTAAFLFAPPYSSVRINRQGDLIAVIAFVVVGAAVGILVDKLSRLADKQAALRRLATLAAHAAPPDEVFAAVTEEVGRLLPADITRMLRYESDGTVTSVAGWNRAGDHVPLGDRARFGGKSLSTFVSQTGRPARVDSYADASDPVGAAAREQGFHSSAGAPIFVEGRVWGVMAASSTSDRPLPRCTEARLADFTDLVATAIANAESRAELAASRARVVAAADETRRRIERDLHDGTQQRLVSLGLELRAAETMVPPELTELRAQLCGAAKGLADVVENLQEISRGIHPAILSKGGLGPAIKTLARRSAVPVQLDLRGDKRLPEGIEVAAYYIVSEALTNAAKHAHASVVHVGVKAQDAFVRLSIRDDGIGGADPTRGSGLIGLRDRVETVGGRMEIASAAGSGTSLLVTIPINLR